MAHSKIFILSFVIFLIVIIGTSGYLFLPRSSIKNFSAVQVLVIERQSGSTNTLPNTFTVYTNGKTEYMEENTKPFGLHLGNHVKTKLDITKLKSILEQIGDVSTIPTGICGKSVSFGTSTNITYKGKTSGDIQCIQSQDPIYTQLVSELYNLKSLTIYGKINE